MLKEKINEAAKYQSDLNSLKVTNRHLRLKQKIENSLAIGMASNSYRQSYKNTTEKSTKADLENYFQKKNNSQIIIDENYNNNDGFL
jgi:hypothetical protein